MSAIVATSKLKPGVRKEVNEMFPEAHMTDEKLRLALGQRIKELRKLRGWTQKDLADKLGLNFSHLNKYEGGWNVPPIEKLISIAEVLDVTVDFLLTGNASEDKPLHNTRLLERFRALEGAPHEDKETVIKLIDALIVRQKVESAVRPSKRKSA
jgi:transcriptional regulator with XRE-family HTH domain